MTLDCRTCGSVISSAILDLLNRALERESGGCRGKHANVQENSLSHEPRIYPQSNVQENYRAATAAFRLATVAASASNARSTIRKNARIAGLLGEFVGELFDAPNFLLY